MAVMTIDKVRERVQRIRSVSSDDERAHIFEDELYRDLLEAISEGKCSAPGACAWEALKSQEIQFARWCA